MTGRPEPALRVATFEQLLVTLRRWWWLPVLLGLLGGGAARAQAAAEPPTYEARADFLVGSIAGDVGVLRASGQLVQTYVQLIDSDLIWDEIFATWDRPEFFSATALGISDTRVLQITATATDPETAAAGANEVGRALRVVLSRTTTGPEGAIRELSAAVPPQRPVAPNIRLSTLLGAVAGVALGAAILLVIARRRDVVTSPGSLAPLAVVARLQHPDRVSTETTRLVGARLAQTLHVAGVRSFAVVAVPAQVPATTPRVLAEALHRAGLMAATVEHVRDDGTGGRVSTEPFGSDLDVFVDGTRRRASGAVAVERSVADLLESYDTVIGWTAERRAAVGLLTATATGAAVLEVRRNQTRLEDVREVTEELESLGVRVLGAVFLDHAGRSPGGGWRSRPATATRPFATPLVAPGTPPLVPVRDRDGVA